MKEKASFNWFPGHMNKSIKEIQEKIPVVDLVIEIVDARAPFSTQNPIFRKLLSQRPKLTILSKGDLADPDVTAKWMDYFEANGDKSFVLESKQKSIYNEVVYLIELMTERNREKQISRGIEKPQLNVLVVGIPNVGKSSFISRLVPGKHLKIGNKPGVTRGMQRIKLTDQITLIDTPGILPSKFENETIACTCAATNAIKLEVVPQERLASKMMRYVYNSYPNVIDKSYKITPHIARPINFDDTYRIFEEVAKRMKFFILNDVPDVERAISLFVHDLHNNNFGRISYERPIEVMATRDQVLENEDVDFTVESDLTIEW